MNDIFNKSSSDHNQFEAHQLTFFAIIFVLKGKGKHSINFTDYTYSEGAVLTIRQDSVHKFFKSEAQGIVLAFTEEFAVQYLDKKYSKKIFQLFNELLISPKLQLDEENFNQFKMLLTFIEKEYQNIENDYSLEIIRSMLHIIVTKLLSIKTTSNKVLAPNKYLSQFINFQQLVEQNLIEYKKVQYYADALHITTKTLNNITHSVVQKSAKSVIIDLLILKIKGALINTNLNASEIAFELGFNDTSHLFKLFKKHTDISPSAFRKLHQ